MSRRALVLATALTALPGLARADGPTAPPPPYSLPWQLRPAAVANVVRSDTAVAHADDGEVAVVSTLLASYKVTPKLAPLARIAFTRDDPAMGSGSTNVSNPLFGLTWAEPLAPTLKLSLLAAFTLPVGSGGGDAPAAAAVAANKAAIMARSSMDNALFAVNDHAIIVGADLAWVDRSFTVQAEATLFQLSRVRGAMAQPDAHRTNLTTGLHAGWFATPWLSLGAELRYQRWLSTPSYVAANASLRENLSTAIGVRGHVKLSGGRVLRPGLAWAHGLDDPMRLRGENVILVDVPVSF